MGTMPSGKSRFLSLPGNTGICLQGCGSDPQFRMDPHYFFLLHPDPGGGGMEKIEKMKVNC